MQILFFFFPLCDSSGAGWSGLAGMHWCPLSVSREGGQALGLY